MKWPRRIAGVLGPVCLLGLVAGALPPQACACSCIAWSTPDEAAANSNSNDAIFVGVPTNERQVDDNYLYDVDVSAVYKGSVLDRATIYTSAEGGYCGKLIAVGQEYVLFGSTGNGENVNLPEGAMFEVSSCDPDFSPAELRPALTQKYGEPTPY